MQNIVWILKKYGMTALSLVIVSFLIYSILIYYSIDARPWIFYDSDSAYFPYLYQDLLIKKGHITAWRFSPVPYFFPDGFLYFTLAYLFSNLRFAIVAYAVVQFFLYYLLITQVGIAASSNKDAKYIFQVSACLSLLLVATGHLQQQTLNFALISQSHFGGALVFLACCWLIIKTFDSSSYWYYVGLLVLIFLTTFSDVLFLTQFVVPAICSMLMMQWQANSQQRIIYTTNLFMMIIGAVCAYLLYQAQFFYLHLDTVSSIGHWLNWQTIIAKCLKIKENLSIFYNHNALVTFILGIYLIGSACYVIHAAVRKNTDNKFLFVHTVLIMNIVISFFSLLYLDNILMVPGFNQLRHIQPSIIFPVFLGVPLFLALNQQFSNVIKNYYPLLISAIAAYTFCALPAGSISNIIHFYPKSIACLDHYAKIYHFKNGVSNNYWEVRSSTFLSKQQLHIVNLHYSYNYKLMPRHYFNTAEDYLGRDFTFIIVAPNRTIDSGKYYSVSTTLREKQFGKAIHEFNCPGWDMGINKIYIYPTGVMNKHIDLKK